MASGRDALCGRLGHRFADPGLLDDALTHRSARGRHNERLEFLGDAVLALVIAEALYHHEPRLAEGDLTRMRAALVCAPALGELGDELGLGGLLALGSGELKSGGHRRRSTLGDALEAVIGAVYLDAGFDAAKAAVLRVFAERLASPPDPSTLKDPKTRLQERQQARGLALPVYELAAEHGEPHQRRFEVRCTAGGAAAVGSGRSRRAAEQEAAAAVLEVLEASGG